MSMVCQLAGSLDLRLKPGEYHDPIHGRVSLHREIFRDSSSEYTDVLTVLWDGKKRPALFLVGVLHLSRGYQKTLLQFAPTGYRTLDKHLIRYFLPHPTIHIFHLPQVAVHFGPSIQGCLVPTIELSIYNTGAKEWDSSYELHL